MKTLRTSILGALLVCILGLGLASCGPKSATANPPNPINTGATITLDLARSIRLVEDTIRQANANKLVSDATTASVLGLTIRINQAGQQADNVLRSQANLTPDQKVSLRTLLNPLITAIQTSISTDIIKISDVNTRNQIQSALLAIQTTINATLAAIGGN